MPEIDSSIKRFYISAPNSIFDLGLKAKYLAKYLDYYQNNYEFSTAEWKVYEEKGLAEKHTFSEEEILKIIQSKTPQHLPNAKKTCEWCYSSTYALHKHHYPKKRCEGGKNTVLICPNCHYEFHYLEKLKYRIKSEYESVVVL